MKYYRNIHYDTKRSEVYLWDYNNEFHRIPWAPFVFEITERDTGVKSIYGDNVSKIEFQNYQEYTNFQKNHTVYENSVNPCIQYLTERYSDNSNIELPDLHICYVDIETPYDNGFPTVEKTPATITLISCIDENDNITVFGIHDYNGKYINRDNFKFYKCIDEAQLLIKFMDWFDSEKFSVITGWNISSDQKMNKFGGFDIPYIIRRCIRIFGEKGSPHRKLSPIRNVNLWESKIKNGVYSVDIAGITVLDYLALYKWFSFNNLESYRLDYVAEIELKQKKLDHSEYKTFYEFYTSDWDKFVDYCILDSRLVYRLEDKLGFIRLAQTLTSYCGCALKSYNTSVSLIEGLMLKYYRNNNLCAPTLHSGKQTWFPAAYVKPPLVGFHKDVIDLDIASSYPTHIIILNMSLETYYGRIIGFDKKDVDDFKKNKGIHEPLHEGRPIYKTIVNYTRSRYFPEFYLLKDEKIIRIDDNKLKTFNTALKRKGISIAPNGAIFKNSPKGVIAHVEQSTFEERVKQKGLKAKYKKMASEDPKNKEKWTEMSQNRHVLQWAIKILINSMYGIMAVPYSRYFNVHMAEAVTSCGRHTIQKCEKYTDDLLNSPNEKLLNIIKEIKDVTK